jgi:ADP-ribosylglycohydrolase
MNTLPRDYEQRVYAGVLGKIIGVYLGRPFEGWSNKRIEEELGEVNYYVHERLNHPLIVSDDDISGTFTFLRALPDHGLNPNLKAKDIGETWLNYLIDRRTILWWGGMGVSTEHTAYLRLKSGIPAPKSGSIALNGAVVAEQIGAQIFIDGWGMVCPGDPERASALACEAGSVSHDGEALYGAQVVAAMEAQAFVEDDINKLLDIALTFIPRASVIYQVIQDIREWHARDPLDWRATLRKIEDKYGYDKYGGGCHMVPNHALIILGLLYGDDDFQKSLMVTNTAGWDTDCNSANVGCLMGIKNGLAGIEKTADFRTPVADRLYLPTADGGRCVTDAVRESYEIINIARGMCGLPALSPKQGMRFHFSFPDSVQGFMPEDSPESRGTVTIRNISQHEAGVEGPPDERVLELRYHGIAPGRVARVATATFLTPEALKGGGYFMMACPTLYPGQVVRARLVADSKNIRRTEAGLFIRVYGKDDTLEIIRTERQSFDIGEAHSLEWVIPDTAGRPIAEIGIEISGASGDGKIYLGWVGWGGAPKTTLRKPESGKAWRRAWVNAVDEFREWGVSRTFGLVQNEGTGLLYQGECSWSDYALVTSGHAHLAEAWGIVAAVRGMRRYFAVILDNAGVDGRARLIERYDDTETVLAEEAFPWVLYENVPFTITIGKNGQIMASVGADIRQIRLVAQSDPERTHGAAGMYVQVGHCQFSDVRIESMGA